MLSGVLLLTGALAGFAAIGLILLRGHRQDMAMLDRRLGVLASHAGGSDAAPSAPRLPQIAIATPRWMEPLLAQAQLEPTPQMLAILGGGFVVCFVLLLALFGLGIALLGVLLIAGLLAFYLTARAARRRDALVDALPYYLDAVRQLMSIGNSLPQALTRALPAASGPVQSYFGAAVRRIELGAPLGETMQGLADRLAIPEVAMLAAAIRVNLRFGGPMAAILGNLAQIVRERLRIKRELASATAEIKVSTQVLIAMPLLLVAFLLFSNPAYRHFFFDQPRGHKLAALAAGLQGVGILVMIRMKRMAF